MKDYIEKVLKTEADPEIIKLRLATRRAARLLHAGIGMETEVGEFLDQLKKHFFYGKDLDVVNLLEELGDLQWYIAIALDELKSTFDEIQQKNIAKLYLRYGVRFYEEKALNRDLEKERTILESKE